MSCFNRIPVFTLFSSKMNSFFLHKNLGSYFVSSIKYKDQLTHNLFHTNHLHNFNKLTLQVLYFLSDHKNSTCFDIFSYNS